MHLGRFSEAFNTDRQVLKLSKNNYEAVVLAAILADELGHFEFGIKACNKAIALRHNVPDVWALKGKMLRKLGKYPDALLSLKQSLDLFGESENAWKEYGLVLSKVGQYQEAISAFERALHLCGEDAELRTWIAACRKNLNRLDDSETATAQKQETETILKTDPRQIPTGIDNESTDTERKNREFFPAFDHHTVMDRPGPGVHEQKS